MSLKQRFSNTCALSLAMGCSSKVGIIRLLDVEYRRLDNYEYCCLRSFFAKPILTIKATTVLPVADPFTEI